jgi:hypothetical protein
VRFGLSLLWSVWAVLNGDWAYRVVGGVGVAGGAGIIVAALLERHPVRSWGARRRRRS